MSEYVNRFFSSLVFMTRIPVKIPFEYKAKSQNIAFFPLVGLIAGLLIVAVAYLSSLVFPADVSSIITVLALVVITGGLHLDGLSDSFDGLLSYRDKEKIILIMKDSRIGAMGLLAVVFVIMFKVAFVEMAIDSENILLILSLPVAGRMAIVMACYKGRSMNKSIMGEPFIGKLSKSNFYGAMMSLLMYFFYGIIYSISFIFALLMLHFIVIALKEFSYNKIDGISGDILGAICEISETLYIPLFYTGVFICNQFI